MPHKRSSDKEFRRKREVTSTHRKLRLKDTVGVIGKKQSLLCSLLNVDGLSHSSYEDVKHVLATKKSDVCFILESHRREEQIGFDMNIDGYMLREVRRSDCAGDKGGGGIGVYTRQVDGLVFHEFSPNIENENHHFVNKERLWILTESSSMKTAVCGAYFGCQHPDNRNAGWNEAIYDVIHRESVTL